MGLGTMRWSRSTQLLRPASTLSGSAHSRRTVPLSIAAVCCGTDPFVRPLERSAGRIRQLPGMPVVGESRTHEYPFVPPSFLVERPLAERLAAVRLSSASDL
jgi:hypothetical protein